MDVFVIFLATLLGYVYLRSLGGEGLNIKAQIAPASTQAGRRERVLGVLIILIMVGAVGYTFAQEDGGQQKIFGVIVPFVLGGLAVLVPSLMKKRRK